MGAKENISDIKMIQEKLFFGMLSLTLLTGMTGLAVFADIIVDNGDIGTSYTQTWRISGGSEPYGDDSLWARDGATYTWSFDRQPAGSYEVLMWWSEWPSRSTAIDVTINYYGGSETISINQYVNAGQWNSLGTYNFDSSGSVTITAANGSTVSTCADAVWFREVAGNLPPTATIDSITPNPANAGESISFIGHGDDADGNVTAYNWQSSIDGDLSDANAFSTNSLSEGLHTITFRVKDNGDFWSEEASEILIVGQIPLEVIIDNLDAQTSQTGTWSISGGAEPYGENSYWSRDGASFTWSFTPPQSGAYDVSMWWTQWSSRSGAAPVDITHSGGTTRVYVNQQQNGGQWNYLGTYFFNQVGEYSVTIIAEDPFPTSYCADAVKFSSTETNIAPVAIIDSITPNPAEPGQTVTFAGYGQDADGNVVAYSWNSSIDGNLSNLASFAIDSLSEGQHTINFRVQDNDGSWSQAVTEILSVGAISYEVIIDNRDSQTSRTGTWSVSGGANPYEVDSYWSRDGTTFTWYFTPAQSGQYDVSMWWTQWPSRSDSVPVDIEYSGGTSIVYINQQQNTGQWNNIGNFTYQAGLTYSVTVTSQAGPSSTCADAVRFVYQGGGGGNIPPAATIDSISPNPANPGQTVYFSGHGTDSDGTITGYNWRSSIEGNISSVDSFSKSDLSTGTHTIFFRVRDDANEWSNEVSRTLTIGQQSEEHIYVCPSYGGPELMKPLFIDMLEDIGASQQGSVWVYENYTQGKTYIIHFAENFSSLINALETPNAHVMIIGHANYGLGTAFATPGEAYRGIIEDIRYIDDDRILNLCTPWAHVSVNGMRTGQAYPFWWPVFQNGTNGIMPYDFNDPRGDPPYNYYLTYQVPGNTTYYKVETVRNSALERFSDSRKDAWYSADGSEPNPDDPNHLKYYITNTEPWSPSFESVGYWAEIYNDNSNFFKENYLIASAGQGNRRGRFLFTIPTAGNYNISAWWPASSSRAANVPYTINHGLGSTTIPVNQQLNGGRWNVLGQFYFDANENYSVVVTDDVGSGNVAVDAVRISHVDNPPDIVEADFVAIPTSGPAPLNVQFINTSTGDLTDRTWNFGDGLTNTTRDFIDHQYMSPGVYTVSLSVSGPTGSDSITKVNYITVGGATPALRADFSTWSNSGPVPLRVSFRDSSESGVSEPNGIVSWFWNFGDGQTGTEQNPTHSYSDPGNYTVSLTVTNINGQSDTVTKQNFVRAVIFEKHIDNVDYPKTHYRGKTLLYTGGPQIDKNNFRYSRLMYDSCNSGNYYIEMFNRGLMFYTVANSGGHGSILYLRYYLQGRSDEQIWQIIQDIEPAYDFYNFNEPPPALSPPAPVGAQPTKATASVEAFEPLTTEQEQKIQQLQGLSVEEVFDRLKEIDFVVNEMLLKQAVSTAFEPNKPEAIELALEYVKLPLTELVNDEVVSRTLDFYVAKKTLQAFPDDSIPKLLELYDSNNVIAKSNIIRAVGPMVSNQTVRNLLAGALDDKTTPDEKVDEQIGEPLRICDIAYNQLVLNLKIKDVLRVIGTGHNIEVREYHIAILKGKL